MSVVYLNVIIYYSDSKMSVAELCAYNNCIASQNVN